MHAGSLVVEVQNVVPVVSRPRQSAPDDIILLRFVHDIVGRESAMVTIFDDGLGCEMNVEVALVARVNEELVAGQGELALVAFIDQH